MREKKQFYYTARGSLYECLPLVQVCLDLHYFNGEHYQNLYNLMNEVGKMLAGLVRSVVEN